SNRPVVGTRSLLVRTPTTVRGGYDKNLASRSAVAVAAVAIGAVAIGAVAWAEGAGVAAAPVFLAPRWALPPGHRVGVVATTRLAGAAHAPRGRPGQGRGRRGAGGRRGRGGQVAGGAGGPAGRWRAARWWRAGRLPAGRAEPWRRVPEGVLDRPPDLVRQQQVRQPGIGHLGLTQRPAQPGHRAVGQRAGRGQRGAGGGQRVPPAATGV